MTSRALIAGFLLCLAGCADPSDEVPVKLGAGTTFEIHSVCAEATETSQAAKDPITGEELFLVTPPIITAADITSIKRIDAGEAGAAQFTVTADAANRMTAATAQQTGRLAMVVNGKLVSAPKILAQISSPFHVAGSDDHDLFNQLTKPSPPTEEPQQ